MADGHATILVCDDELALRELMKVTLGDGYDYAEAADAAEALRALRNLNPDLVLLDVMLPGRSGLELLRDMRADPTIEPVPVVVVSAWQSTEDYQAALDAGADGFLGKPFQPEELISLVDTLLRERR